MQKENKNSTNNVVSSDVSSEKIKDIKFSYFDTLFAYSCISCNSASANK